MNKIIKNDKPLFFLFTCVKEGRKYINTLFDSLLKQTKINFAHYIYEDGSSEPLGEMIDEYKENVLKLTNPYKVIYEYNLNNIGLTRATQYCISKCSCPFFIWIDCDNYVDSHFFEELERLYRRKKKSLILRTALYISNTNELYYANCGSIDEANTNSQLGLFIRRKFYYSFFAVNYEKYRFINPNNTMINEKGFYNDEQLLTVCLLNREEAPLTKKAKGYFLIHDNQESNQYRLPLIDFRKLQIKLCYSINEKMGQKITAVYIIKDKYDELFQVYRNDYKYSVTLIKDIKNLSKQYNISLHNYHNYSLVKIYLKTLYWKLRK